MPILGKDPQNIVPAKKTMTTTPTFTALILWRCESQTLTIVTTLVTAITEQRIPTILAIKPGESPRT